MSQDEELRWVRRREGAHRSSSRATPGYERDLLRQDDSENLLGPTESRPADIDEIVRSHMPPASPRATAGQEFGRQIGDAIMDALAPYIERGVDVAVDQAVIGISKLWRWATSKSTQRKVEGESEVESGDVESEVATRPAVVIADVNDESDAIASQTQSMTAEQYQAILLSALLADQYAARARQMLANVRVHDEVLPVELESAITAALNGPEALIDDASLAQVVEILRESKASDGEFVLVRSDQDEVSLPVSDSEA